MSTKEASRIGPINGVRVVFDKEVHEKIMHWINKTHKEVSGLGKLILEPNGVYRVISAMLLDQQNTSRTTDIDAAAVGKAMYELRDSRGFLNFWWHSHVNMEVFWSGTDKDTIREIGSGGFVVATVLNKRNQMRSAFYAKETEMLPAIFIDDLNTTVSNNLPKSLTDAWDAEFDDKIKEKVYAPRGGSNYADGRYYDKYQRRWVYPNYPATTHTKDETPPLDKDQEDFYSRYSDYLGDYEYNRSSDSNDHTTNAVSTTGEVTTYENADYTQVDEISDNAKVAALKNELEILATAMVSDLHEKSATNKLFKICSIINKAKIKSKVKSQNLRFFYIDRYNLIHGKLNQPATTTQPASEVTQ